MLKTKTTQKEIPFTHSFIVGKQEQEYSIVIKAYTAYDALLILQGHLEEMQADVQEELDSLGYRRPKVVVPEIEEVHKNPIKISTFKHAKANTPQDEEVAGERVVTEGMSIKINDLSSKRRVNNPGFRPGRAGERVD